MTKKNPLFIAVLFLFAGLTFVPAAVRAADEAQADAPAAADKAEDENENKAADEADGEAAAPVADKDAVAGVGSVPVRTLPAPIPDKAADAGKAEDKAEAEVENNAGDKPADKADKADKAEDKADDEEEEEEDEFAGEDGVEIDGEAAPFDLSQLGIGAPAGPPPAWQKKLEDVEPLLQGAYAAHQEGKREEALANLAKVMEIIDDPDIPARHVGELVYMLGIMHQQLEKYDQAAALFARMTVLADAEGMEVFGRNLFKGLGLLQLAEMLYLQQDKPEEALARFEEALALEGLPAEFRSTLLAREFGLRMSYEKLFDADKLRDLVRREAVWSVFQGEVRANNTTDARLPGNLASALVLAGRVDDAKALLDILENERGKDPLAAEMAVAAAYAHAAVKDADGAARWLGRELSGQAIFRSPRDFGRYLDWLEKSHAFRDVKDAEPMTALFADWRGKTAVAAESKQRTVVLPPPPEGIDFSSFGG